MERRKQNGGMDANGEQITSRPPDGFSMSVRVCYYVKKPLANFGEIEAKKRDF